MSIQNLYKNYFQKSKTFLFPIMGIIKGLVTSPTTTFISWDGFYSVHDMKLICLYNTKNPAHQVIEHKHLFSHPLFEKKFDLGNGNLVYIFDLSSYKNDYELFLQGKYSQLSEALKNAITNYFGIWSAEYEYLESFLYPQGYYDLYSELLDIKVCELKEVVELCNPYDPEKEDLTFLLK